MPRTVFDVPALNARQQDLDQLAAALGAGLLSSSVADAADVGMSYGAVGVLGTFTAALPPRWRPIWAGWWLAVAAGSAALSGGDFTNAGHAVALMIGMVVGTRLGRPAPWTRARWALLGIAVGFGYVVVGYNELSIPATAAFGMLGALTAGVGWPRRRTISVAAWTGLRWSAPDPRGPAGAVRDEPSEKLLLQRRRFRGRGLPHAAGVGCRQR